MREKIAQVKAAFPDEVDEPRVQRFDPASRPIWTVALTSPDNSRSPSALTTYGDQVLKKRLETVRGVGSVALVGGSAREVFAKHQAFFLYANTGEARYRPEALAFLAMVVAYFNGKTGKTWNPNAVRYAALDLLDTLERRPETFATLSQRLIDQMRREIRDYFTGNCLGDMDSLAESSSPVH